MNIALSSGEWHGISIEDLLLGVAGVVFAYVLARVFSGPLPHQHGRIDRADRKDRATRR